MAGSVEWDNADIDQRLLARVLGSDIQNIHAVWVNLRYCVFIVNLIKGGYIMKVLVTYFSQSGNTEKIAKGIWEEASQANEADLKKLEDVAAEDFAGYDFIFIGSPLHSANLAAPVKAFLTNIQAGSGQKMAGFITHSAPAYPDQDMDAFTEPIKTACKEKGIEYKGCFDCQGALTESMHEAVQKKHNLSDEQWAGTVKQMTGHPNEADLADAKACAKEVLG
jgi:flavodoxin I